MKIKTSILQEMVSKSIKGASMNKMIPITSLLGIEIKRDALASTYILSLKTTDGSNQLTISNSDNNELLDVSNEMKNYSGNAEAPIFYSIVNADTFAKLVGKTTKEYMELINEQNFLMVKGNGNYKLEVAINEEGEMIKFAKKSIEKDEATVTEKLSVEKLKALLTSGKVCTAKTMELPCLTGYYISSELLTTDRQMVCYVNDKVTSEPILLSDTTAELLQLLEGTEVELIKNDNELLFKTDNIAIYAKELEGKELYPVQPIKNLVNSNYDSKIKVNKQDLLNVLDRMALFVSDYDKGGIYLNISNDGLEIRSQQSNATELLEIKLDNPDELIKEFECLVDIEMLKSQVQSIVNDIVELYYGQKSSIKLKEGNTTMILSLVQKAE